MSIAPPARLSFRSSPWIRLAPLAVASALACGFAPLAQAQSLLDLYQTARGYDATYLAARALADSAEYRAAQAHALRRPNVGLNLSTNRGDSDIPSGDTSRRDTTGSIAGTQSLFNRANDKQIEQADRGYDLSRADLELAEQDLIVRVSTAYFDVLAAQDTLGSASQARKAISEQLASAKRNFEVGTATITDTREAQARFDLTTAQELAADNDLRFRRIALDQLVGRANVEPRPLAVPVALPGVLPDNVDTWVTQTETAPTVRRAALGYQIAQLETEKARAGHLPTFELGASYGRGRTATGGTQLATTGAFAGTLVPINSDFTTGSATQSNVSLTMRMPLFAGFAVQNRVKETLLLEEQNRNNLDAAKRSVAQATRQAFFGVQSLQAQVKALEAAESSSQLALDATQLGYRVGVRVNLDVLNAQTQLYNTRRDLARARYDVVLTGLRLRQAAGQLRPEDVTAVNSLLAR
jgi:outer membrane protein